MNYYWFTNELLLVLGVIFNPFWSLGTCTAVTDRLQTMPLKCALITTGRTSYQSQRIYIAKVHSKSNIMSHYIILLYMIGSIIRHFSYFPLLLAKQVWFLITPACSLNHEFIWLLILSDRSLAHLIMQHTWNICSLKDANVKPARKWNVS